jgi:hypothetical protein
MKAALIILAGFVWLLTGCNSFGPYSGTVYGLAPSVYQVSVNTWVGSGNGWPNGNADLKRKIEAETLATLRAQGLRVESCVVRSFIPFEGGHMTISLLAGAEAAVAHWAALPDERFTEAIQKARPLPQVLVFTGSLPR